jgi:polysaccharide chain length determinant protein (PEP-CTERM system associated)
MNVTEQIDDSSPLGWRYLVNIGAHRRWWFITSAILLWAAALTLSIILPQKFRSETVVLVEPGDVSTQYVPSNISQDLQQRLQRLTEQTLSRSNLAQIVSDFHLYGNSPAQASSEDEIKQMRSDLAVELTRANNGGEISAFKISYSGSTPEQAQKVTARLASLFVQESVGRQQRAAEDTTSFLESQVEEARNDMQNQEKVLRQFRSKDVDGAPQLQAVNLQILSGLQERLRSATQGLHEAEKQKASLSSPVGPVAAMGSNPSADSLVGPSSPLDEQIEKMKAELGDLSAGYTPLHPDVVRLKKQIANAEKIRNETAQRDNSQTSGAGDGGLETAHSPRSTSALAQWQSQFTANEQEIANRKQEINDIQKQIEQRQARLISAPAREQEVTEATQNYEESRARYESLLAKKQQSEMTTGLSKMQKEVGFSTVEPPSLPRRPYWPNPLKFSGIGLLAGMLLGLIATVVKETVDARVYGEDDLRKCISLPVIATVPPLTTFIEKSEHMRRRRIEIALASLLAAVVPAFTVLAYLKG